MALPRFIEIDGRRYFWRDLVALRRAQATPTAVQPSLFTLRETHQPAGERDAGERYNEPSLFNRSGAEPLGPLSPSGFTSA
jgi:hypothetical protein